MNVERAPFQFDDIVEWRGGTYYVSGISLGGDGGWYFQLKQDGTRSEQYASADQLSLVQKGGHERKETDVPSVKDRTATPKKASSKKTAAKPSGSKKARPEPKKFASAAAFGKAVQEWAKANDQVVPKMDELKSEHAAYLKANVAPKLANAKQKGEGKGNGNGGRVVKQQSVVDVRAALEAALARAKHGVNDEADFEALRKASYHAFYILRKAKKTGTVKEFVAASRAVGSNGAGGKPEATAKKTPAKSVAASRGRGSSRSSKARIQHTCPMCERDDFKNLSGLKRHITVQH